VIAPGAGGAGVVVAVELGNTAVGRSVGVVVSSGMEAVGPDPQAVSSRTQAINRKNQAGRANIIVI
jgi:hypothetical protein